LAKEWVIASSLIEQTAGDKYAVKVGTDFDSFDLNFLLTDPALCHG